LLGIGVASWRDKLFSHFPRKTITITQSHPAKPAAPHEKKTSGRTVTKRGNKQFLFFSAAITTGREAVKLGSWGEDMEIFNEHKSCHAQQLFVEEITLCVWRFNKHASSRPVRNIHSQSQFYRRLL
jgi:hypothetical protein